MPVDGEVNGWLGVAVSANTMAKLYVDDELIQYTPMTRTGNIQSNIPGIAFTHANSTLPPAGSAPFTFVPGARHKIRLEYQVYNLFQKFENVNSVNAEIELFWNLVDTSNSIQKAVDIASDADVIILAVGANWDSDGEGGDRSTLSLSANQTQLAEAIFDLGKPVIMVLQGGRPFAIPEFYDKSAAVINAYFPGQSEGQAISDVLFGKMNPGGRIPVSVPRHVGTLPVFYHYKATARFRYYADDNWAPLYSFGYGLSYTTFELSSFSARSSSGEASFKAGDTVTFEVDVKNNGTLEGSYVAQVYLLARVSSITQPVKQLMAFQRVYLEAGETRTVRMELEVDRYLPILNREWEWELEKGEYTFALLENSAFDADRSTNVTLSCV